MQWARRMNRRRSIAFGLGIFLLTPLCSVAAQTKKVRRVAYLTADRDRAAPGYRAFVVKLRELGWMEGDNLKILHLTSDGRDEAWPDLAARAVNEKVDVIVTVGSPSTRAAKSATDKIPIVFGSAGNPVEQKFVASLARPGGNVTGLALHVQDLGPKRLEYMKAILPNATRSARIYDPRSLSAVQPGIMREEDEAAKILGLKHEHIPASNLDELRSALSNAARSGVEIAHVTSASLFVLNRADVAKVALENRLALLGPDKRFAEAGALLSYGENSAERFARVASLVDKILNGLKPADLPIDQSAKFELIVNKATAAKLGIAIPASFQWHQPEFV
jgi:putative tryptophan/tyrosine transport system substrate-binding protein